MFAKTFFAVMLPIVLCSLNSVAQENGAKTEKAAPSSDSKGQSPEGDKKQDEDESDSIKRPIKPPRVPDPREFDEAVPDANGLVRFNFYGQPWPDLIQWLANLSKRSLDWQELPNDYVNITTTRPHSIPEIHDLFSWLLLERGYTMIRRGQILSVSKIEKIDPSLLTRVDDASVLLDLPAHEFVKITFKLPSKLKADRGAGDIKPLLSPHAKVQPLLATNRLLVIDAVVNLREVSQLLNAEHAAATGHVVPHEFVLRFARADRVADQVMILLGLDPSSRRPPQELQVEQQRLQLFQQMQQKGKDVTKYLRQADAPRVFLTVNQSTNSILVNSPPEEMQIIRQAIQQLDVPAHSALSASLGPLTLEKYQLVAISPAAIVTALEEIGNLDPKTRLRMDTDAKVVFARATRSDHEKIKGIIDNLDGTGRQLEVIWLRRLPAQAVAATLQKLMVGGEKEEESSGRPHYFYSYRNQEPEKPKSEFRVDADIERNRLLLWATEAELEQVKRFLEKLGEIPGRSGNPHTVRFLDRQDPQTTRRLLEQLQRIWNGSNPLRIEQAQPAEEEPTQPTPKSKDAQLPRSTRYRLSSHVSDERSDKELGERPGTQAAPIVISIGQDGRIMLSSSDTTALDRLEDLLSSLTPPAPNYKVFYLEHAQASLVTLNLEEYFEEETEVTNQENWWRAYYGFNFEGGSLSQQQKIRFIWDYDTNSILVASASPSQLNVVERLIKLYD